MVVFKDDPENYNSNEMFLKIQDDMENVMALVKQINKMEEDIILNPIVNISKTITKKSLQINNICIFLIFL